jgi:anti-sigma factor RsiW
MSDRFTEQLSPYLDGELDARAAARLEQHLGECLDCTRTLAELRAIVAAAPGYPGREPSRDLWSAIASRLDEPEVVSIDSVRRNPVVAPEPLRAGRRFGWRELIAASVVMAAIGGGAVWLAVGPSLPTAAPVTAVGRVDGDSQAVLQAGAAEAEYDAAVRDLEQLLAAGRERLDSSTVRTIEQSLARIDVAITEARVAVQRDPSSAYLSRQIAANMRRKLNLLRVATQAIAART